MAKVNTLNPRSFESIIGKISQSAGLDKTEVIQLRSAFQKVDLTLNDDGSVKHQANVSGRTEPLSTTLTHVAATGNFDSLANVNDTSTDHLTDGTGTPLQGGKNATLGLSASGQLKGTFKNNQVNVTGIPTAATALSNTGASTVITLAADSFQFGDGVVTYNSGSIDPGSFGSFSVFAHDATFAGGAQPLSFTGSAPDLSAANDIVSFGSITTVNGTSKTGGGNTGGTTGSGGTGGRGFNQL